MSGGTDAAQMLTALGLSPKGVTTVTRGTGAGSGTRLGGSTISQSNYIGNSSSSDIYDSTMAGVTDTQNTAMAKATNGETPVSTEDIDNHIVDILTLLKSVINNGTMNVSLSDTMSGAFPK
jgi:hypothetical protein